MSERVKVTIGKGGWSSTRTTVLWPQECQVVYRGDADPIDALISVTIGEFGDVGSLAVSPDDWEELMAAVLKVMPEDRRTKAVSRFVVEAAHA